MFPKILKCSNEWGAWVNVKFHLGISKAILQSWQKKFSKVSQILWNNLKLHSSDVKNEFPGSIKMLKTKSGDDNAEIF